VGSTNVLVRWALAHSGSTAARRLRRLPLVGGAVHTLSHRLSPPGRREWSVVATGPARALKLYADPRYDVAYLRGDAEPQLQRVLLDLVPVGGVFWDVGADLGFFTLLLARHVGAEGAVVAFEPDAPSRRALEQSIAANGFANVEVRPEAIWSAPGSVPFEPRTESVEGYHGAVVEDAPSSVPATTLDLAWNGRPPDVVKIDVEGAEEHALRGARRLLAEGRPAIVCEAHLVRRGDEDMAVRVESLLEAAGYELTELSRGRSRVHLLGTPRERAPG
jgi:FkbM family methyltransferase